MARPATPKVAASRHQFEVSALDRSNAGKLYEPHRSVARPASASKPAGGYGDKSPYGKIVNYEHIKGDLSNIYKKELGYSASQKSFGV